GARSWRRSATSSFGWSRRTATARWARSRPTATWRARRSEIGWEDRRLGILAAAVRELMALGVEGDALVAAIERLERADNETRLVLEAEERRRHEASAGAIRQRRYRERKASRVTSPASPIVTSDAPSPKDIPTSSSTSSLDQNPNPPPL